MGAYLAKVDVQDAPGHLSIDRVLGNVHERLSRDGRPRGDAGRAQQLLLHQVHTPHQQVGGPHRAPAHAAVHLDQARPV